MGRKIKFRYWCNFEKKMYDKAYVEEHMNLAMMSELLEVAQERYTFLQYTGLKDMNDKEIYEGDIVTGKRESHWHGGYDKVRAKVYFSDTTLSYAVDGMGGGYLRTIDDIEVIGNIYEHPEKLQLS